jgi:splicing factor 3A subunit 3
MALTAREREEELENQEDQAPPAETAIGEPEEDDEDEDGKIYNPLKLPLGWDGKPIPFWLYKLHGLGVSFECELCSDSYRGRKVSYRFPMTQLTIGIR